MFRSTMLALAAIAVPASASAQANQFNLVCSGTMTSTSVIGADRVEPYSSTYRIDLAAQKWCEGDCKALHDISSVQPTQLTLEERKVDTLFERSLLVNFIDRETGAHIITSTSSSPRDRLSTLNLRWDGRCEASAFSGFPNHPVKF
jgi:hypothetical protein